MKVGRLLLGMLVGNGAGVLLLALGYVLFSVSPESATAVSLPSLLFVPFCIGLAAAWVWRPLELGIVAVLPLQRRSRVRGEGRRTRAWAAADFRHCGDARGPGVARSSGRAPRTIRTPRQRRRHHHAHRPHVVFPARPSGVVFRLVDARS